jgi:hypothetical protein
MWSAGRTIYPSFPVCSSGLRIVRFSCPRHNEIAPPNEPARLAVDPVGHESYAFGTKARHKLQIPDYEARSKPGLPVILMETYDG